MTRNRAKRVYLAAAYSTKPLLQRLRPLLEADGLVEVISNWLDEPDDPSVQLKLRPEVDEQVRFRDYANRDLWDIQRAEVFVGFSHKPTTPGVRGGRHVELGYALAHGPEIIIVGPMENIFHYLPQVKVLPDLVALAEHLGVEPYPELWTLDKELQKCQ